MSNKLLSEIVKTNELAKFARADEFLEFVNQEPPEIFIEEHPMVKGVKYIPIGNTELTLDKIFQYWKVEILKTEVMFNSIAVTVRVHYKHPISGEWMSQDGVGAVGVQTDKGFTAADLAHIKQDAVMKALPAAKSFAIKDAVDHIGKIFGRDLNRKNTFDFSPSYATTTVKEKLDAQKARLRKNLEKK